MKLTYQTGIAGLVQLGVMSTLNVANGLYSSVQQCTNSSGNCVSNILTSLLYFMAITIWFAFLWILGAAAQDRRSRPMAFILLGAETIVIMASLLDIRHHTSTLGLITSIADVTLAAWVGILAIRLLRAKGGRVTSSARARQRRRPATKV